MWRQPPHKSPSDGSLPLPSKGGVRGGVGNFSYIAKVFFYEYNRRHHQPSLKGHSRLRHPANQQTDSLHLRVRPTPGPYPPRGVEGYRRRTHTGKHHAIPSLLMNWFYPTLPTLSYVYQPLTQLHPTLDATLNPTLDATLMANMRHLLTLLAARLLDDTRLRLIDTRLRLIDTRLPLVEFSRELQQEEPPIFPKQTL